MRIIQDWQYRYIEKCLYNYEQLVHSKLETEMKMRNAIDIAIQFFKGTQHEKMIRDFYFHANEERKKYISLSFFYQKVCIESLFTEPTTGYVIRREIIYRIAMNCYAMGVFQMHVHIDPML